MSDLAAQYVQEYGINAYRQTVRQAYREMAQPFQSKPKQVKQQLPDYVIDDLKSGEMTLARLLSEGILSGELADYDVSELTDAQLGDVEFVVTSAATVEVGGHELNPVDMGTDKVGIIPDYAKKDILAGEFTFKRLNDAGVLPGNPDEYDLTGFNASQVGELSFSALAKIKRDAS